MREIVSSENVEKQEKCTKAGPVDHTGRAIQHMPVASKSCRIIEEEHLKWYQNQISTGIRGWFSLQAYLLIKLKNVPGVFNIFSVTVSGVLLMGHMYTV